MSTNTFMTPLKISATLGNAAANLDDIHLREAITKMLKDINRSYVMNSPRIPVLLSDQYTDISNYDGAKNIIQKVKQYVTLVIDTKERDREEIIKNNNERKNLIPDIEKIQNDYLDLHKDELFEDMDNLEPFEIE